MNAPPTLPVGPLPYLAMDYARLRAEGLRLLQRLAGEQWTDFNTHDPGITILEQLCFAITDLGYRINHPMPDLLHGSAAHALAGPAVILTGDPVTADDLRKTLLDVPGIANGWIELPSEPELPIYHHAGSGELRLNADRGDPGAEPLRLKGLHRVLLRTTDMLSGQAAVEQVAGRLHGARLLGEDLELALLDNFEVWLNAEIEIGATEDATAVLARLIGAIENYFAPAARFADLQAARAEGRGNDELFEGPALRSGFILELPGSRSTLYVSDLVHAIMDVAEVRAVRTLELATSADASRERWAMPIPAGHVARLAPRSTLTLMREGLPVRVDDARLGALLEQARTAALRRPAAATEVEPTAGRSRELSRYSSIQRQLPAVYGIGPLGLPGSATAERRAQARQLEAYLLIFDQLLANAFAQLANAHKLLAPDAEADRTYFAQAVDDLELSRRLLRDPEAHQAWLDQAVEPGNSLERRKRFLAHLLARFAEQLGNRSWLADGDRSEAQAVAMSEAFLRNYHKLGGGRGSGIDVHAGDHLDRRSSFEERLAFKLGIHGQPRFFVIEHVLLRPVPEDAGQLAAEGEPQVPLLSGVQRSDPWSLQVSFVFEERDDPERNFERHVEQTLLVETPAHLKPYLHWFSDTQGASDWSAFEAAWHELRVALPEYRNARLRGTPSHLTQLRFRDARDRVVDLLGFGRSYPLRDLPLPEHLSVSPGSATKIPLRFSQRDVDYHLCHAETGDPVFVQGEPSTAVGTGGPIALATPLIEDDQSYRVRAVKRHGAGDPSLRREVWLRGSIRVEERVDPSLNAFLELPLLDPTIDLPKSTDARIADHGSEVTVVVEASQEGVRYELIDHADHDRVLSGPPVIGTSSTIRLRYGPVREDIDLRVRGSKELGGPDNPTLRSAVLDVVLPLRVRADRALEVDLTPTLAQHGSEVHLVIAQSQASAHYRVWRLPVRDRDYIFDVDPEPAAGTVDVVGDAGRVVHVDRRIERGLWPAQSSLQPVGEARPGTGAALELVLGPAVQDALWFVQASKRHRLAPLDAADDAIVGTSVQLDRAPALLVRPDRDPALRVRVTMADGATVGPLMLSGGQPGVYYELRVREDVVTRPAYFHQLDDEKPDHNKGVGQLRIEIDLALAREAAQVGVPATTRPPIPALDSEPLPAGTVIDMRARKAMTGLAADLRRSAALVAPPTIRAEPDVVASGASAKIVIEDSVSGERYRLLRGDTPLTAPAEGNGGALELETGPLSETTAFTVVVERAPGPTSLPVERRARVTVAVEPA